MTDKCQFCGVNHRYGFREHFECKDRQISALTAHLAQARDDLVAARKQSDYWKEKRDTLQDIADAAVRKCEAAREELADAKERLELWHSFYQAYEPWNYLEGVRAALTPALAKLKAKGEI